MANLFNNFSIELFEGGGLFDINRVITATNPSRNCRLTVGGMQGVQEGDERGSDSENLQTTMSLFGQYDDLMGI